MWGVFHLTRGVEMNNKEVNEKFDYIDLVLKRLETTFKKGIKILGSIVGLGLLTFWGIEKSIEVNRNEKSDDILRIISSKVVSVEERAINNSQSISNLDINKLEKVDFIKKIIDEEYRRMMKKEHSSINQESIKLIETAINEGLLRDEPLFLNSGNWIIKTFREWEFHKKNNE